MCIRDSSKIIKKCVNLQLDYSIRLYPFAIDRANILSKSKKETPASLLFYFYYKYHQRQVALATADDMQQLIHRNLVLLVSAHQAHLIHR